MAQIPARSTLKINRLRMALISQAQTVMGRRGRVRPGARSSMVVMVKFNALKRAEREKIAALMSQMFSPVLAGRKTEAVMPRKETKVSHKENRLRDGKAISEAPICEGRKQLPKPSWGAAVKTKKTMSEPWRRRRAA